MKQTAVEWFYDQITRTYWDYMTTERQNELFQQALAMEKEQIKDAWIATDNELQRLAAEQYYNETYGTSENGR
jgi:hypothetical protein